jgi:hypothetical protein
MVVYKVWHMLVDNATLESRMVQKLFHQHALAQNQPNSQDPNLLCIARGHDREQRNKTKCLWDFWWVWPTAIGWISPSDTRGTGNRSLTRWKEERRRRRIALKEKYIFLETLFATSPGRYVEGIIILNGGWWHLPTVDNLILESRMV